jgi:hypothetical protein
MDGWHRHSADFIHDKGYQENRKERYRKAELPEKLVEYRLPLGGGPSNLGTRSSINI